MPKVAVASADRLSLNDAAHDLLQQMSLGSWHYYGAMTWDFERPLTLLHQPQRVFTSVVHSDLHLVDLAVQPRHVADLYITGDNILDDFGTHNESGDTLSGEYNAYIVQALMAGLKERETGLEEQILAEVHEKFIRPPVQLSERLQGVIDQFENPGYCSEAITESTLAPVAGLVSWLSRIDPNMFAKITEDGMLALEARVALDAQLFIEIDRDGSVEATFANTKLGIVGLNVTRASDLTYDLVVSLIGGS